MRISQVRRVGHLEVERNLPPIRKGLGRFLRFNGSSRDVAAPLSWVDSHYLAEGAREGSLIAKPRLHCDVDDRCSRLPE